MRLAAHILFAFAVLLYVYANLIPPVTLDRSNDVGAISNAIFMAVIVNFVMDAFGHTRCYVPGVGYVPCRSPLTHDVVSGTLTGLLVGLVFSGFSPYVPLKAHIVAGVVGAWTHLLLDLFTEDGIYIGFRRRIGILHISNDSRLVNWGVIILSVILLFYVATTQPTLQPHLQPWFTSNRTSIFKPPL